MAEKKWEYALHGEKAQKKYNNREEYRRIVHQIEGCVILFICSYAILHLQNKLFSNS
ncbi:hypothetical protein [Blautia producta]|uniref:hypothetical protein n=1 Tax=Blautia producta TaxID=33035 RepID=UPI0013EE75E2|nr:hypothetical protein [Blautia producta]